MATSRRVLAMPCAVLLAGLMAGGCGGEKPDESVPVVTVDVASAMRSSIQQTIRADGLVYPRQQAAIVPKIAAPIRALHVERGASVRAGQLLVELENQDLAGAAAESRAAFDLADANFETTAKATVPEEEQKAELDVRAAKDALDAQQAIYDSRLTLRKEGAIAQREVNDAQVNLTHARTQYEIARRRLEDLRGFAHKEALKAARAQREAALGRRDAAEAQLAYSRLTSPIDGVVTDLPFYPGETPPPGAPVVTVMAISQVIVRAHVSQSDAAALAPGNKAVVIGPDGAALPGTVTQISPALDPVNTTVEVWVQAGNPKGALRPGTGCRVEMIVKTVDDALVIPQSAVMTSTSGSTSAVVIDDESKPHVRKITTAIRDAGQVQVTEGLEDGERVATTGAYDLFKLDPAVLSKTTVQIASAAKKEEPDK
jgi:multidrug efflux pump subunit AcrA (membrane-fusion protein)